MRLRFTVASLWTQVCGSSLVCRQQYARRKWRQRVAAIYREPRIPISETFQLRAGGVVTVNFLFINLDVSWIPFLFLPPPTPPRFPFSQIQRNRPPSTSRNYPENSCFSNFSACVHIYNCTEQQSVTTIYGISREIFLIYKNRSIFYNCFHEFYFFTLIDSKKDLVFHSRPASKSRERLIFLHKGNNGAPPFSRRGATVIREIRRRKGEKSRCLEFANIFPPTRQRSYSFAIFDE